MSQAKYVGAIDQGTTSTRFILFDRSGSIVKTSQIEHRQIYPKPGWVEHDPMEIWENTKMVISRTLREAEVTKGEIAAIGITNQRETTVCWNRETGIPYYNAIVWQDTRTSDIIEELAWEGGKDKFRKKTGLPLATYFSASKMKWIIDNNEDVRKDAEAGKAVFGTIDCWLNYCLTGGANGGSFITDVTNASRTMLMDLATLKWDEELMNAFSVKRSMLPQIRSSIPDEPFGYTDLNGPFEEKIPVCGILGDQQAAMFGQACFTPGMSKNTYGTGCFMLLNTGNDLVQSSHGLLTTIAYKKRFEPPVYALEGSVAIAGSLVQWTRDNIGLIENSADIEKLASKVEDSGGVYFVPAFSGLFAPHWRPDARGIIAGLTGYVNSSHIARAVLEATAFQTREIYDAMESDSGIDITTLKVDGGMVVNELLMKFQADLLNTPVIRPKITETTALGAAYAAGLSVNFWKDLDELTEQWSEDKRWLPNMNSDIRKSRIHDWKKAVDRTLNWLE